jgi:tetratricopeptide (TPR) repeat protein
VQDSLSIYQATGNRVGAAAAYANLGVLTASIHKPDEAMDYFELSLGIRESLGDTQGIAITRNNLGQLLARQGQFAEAAKHFSDAVDGARRAGLFQLLAQSLSNLGYALTLLGQGDDALPAFREAESLCVIHGFRNLLCETLWKRAVCHVECGDYASAETAAGEALQLGIELESQDLQSEARRVLSRIFRRKGQIAVSLEESAAAWQARQNDANPIIRARFAAEYGLALTANGQLSEARVFLREHVSTGYLYESKTYLAEIDGVLSDKEGGLA